MLDRQLAGLGNTDDWRVGQGGAGGECADLNSQKPGDSVWVCSVAGRGTGG